MSGLIRKIVTPWFVLLAAGLAGGCAPDGESGLSGRLLFQEKPLPQARVEVYLKAEKDKSTRPFAVTTTDDNGRYAVSLPDGAYFVIGRKRLASEGGRSRMLMAEAPGNPLVVTGGVLAVPAFSLYEMGRQGDLVADAGTGLSGRVTYAGEPVARAYVYIYPSHEGGLIGPSFGEAVQTDAEGRFRIDLPAGTYSLVARKRLDGDRSGELVAGDLNRAYPGNPVRVEKGERLALESFALKAVDADRKAERQAEGTFIPTATLLSGRVVDEAGQPVSGIYLFAYLDSSMIGKPAHISAPSDPAGTFRLYLDAGGTYYVGARSGYGGPLEPGEWVGTYAATADHAVTVADGDKQELGAIVVREVW